MPRLCDEEQNMRNYDHLEAILNPPPDQLPAVVQRGLRVVQRIFEVSLKFRRLTVTITLQ